MAQPLPLPSPSFRHNTGPTRMRMMMIAHHRASCCTCTRGHALIICLQKQYRGTFPVALQTVMPTSLPADIQGMQARVSPAATDFASCPQSPTATLTTLSFLTPICLSLTSSSLRLAKVRPRADGWFRLSARRLHACAPGNDMNFTAALGRKYHACHQPLSVPGQPTGTF
jgi:hypothetical protein